MQGQKESSRHQPREACLQSYPQLRKELHADSCFDTEELIWCEGYTKRKLIKSLAHVKNVKDMAFVEEAPWVVMIDNDAYKIEDNPNAIRVICDLDSGSATRHDESSQRPVEGLGRRQADDSKEWHLRPDATDTNNDKIEPV